MDLIGEYQAFRQILCICPCCGDIVRVSDLHIKVKGEFKKTWLDGFESNVMDIQDKSAKFEEKEDKIREKAKERGRLAAEKVIEKAMYPSLRALHLDPYDVKPILNPIDFIAFNGMTKKEHVTEIVLLSKKMNNPKLNILRNQVKKVVLSKKYDWQVARINESCQITIE